MFLWAITGFVVFSIVIAGIYYARACVINRKESYEPTQGLV